MAEDEGTQVEERTHVRVPPTPPGGVVTPTPSMERRDEAPEGETDTQENLRLLANDRGKSLEPEDLQSTLDWFMDDSQVAEDIEPHYPIQINVSVDPGREDWKDWVIKPIPSPRIDALRRMCEIPSNRQQKRQRRGQPEIDAARFNASLVFDATVDPDLTVAVRQKNFTDGAQMVLHRFRFKPLLVDQIAGQVLEISGGDDADVRTAQEVKAARG